MMAKISYQLVNRYSKSLCNCLGGGRLMHRDNPLGESNGR